MQIKRYQDLASRTLTDDAEKTMPYFGLAGECGEIIDYMKKVYFHGHEFNRMELVKECGDVLWYLAAICTMNNINLEEVATRNIAKLRKRYPNGFESDKSINRGDD